MAIASPISASPKEACDWRKGAVNLPPEHEKNANRAAYRTRGLIHMLRRMHFLDPNMEDVLFGASAIHIIKGATFSQFVQWL
mmetsp:Transcript_1169/g.1891  ORF Transcript_1169/g.1891 Transcript_1169/m.1891 type:complete len:82 (-) Transcript_1169:46-291(-)